MTPDDRYRGIPADSGPAPLRLIREQIERGFRDIRHPLRHTLRIASSNDLIRHVPQGAQSRFIPCVWGVRRDDYGWEAVDGERDVGAFRTAAAGVAAILIPHAAPACRKLLPGGMNAVMDTRSELYLADYWVLTLHHLVWTKRLPYPIQARWAQGSSVHDEVFYFVSELPVDLTEASEDAMILFQEAAMEGVIERRAPPDEEAEPRSAPRPSEPPLYRNGRWYPSEPAQLEAIQHSAADSGEKDVDGDRDHAAQESSGTDATASPEGDSLELDDQSFTVRFGDASYRFAGRNKQLFALLERISRRQGFRVSFDDLRSKGDVWDGAYVEDSTIRGAVARLRRTLKSHGLVRLAGRIATGTYRGRGYVMLNSGASDGPNPPEELSG